MADEYDPKKIPKLTELNYQDWDFQMRNHLRALGWIGPIELNVTFMGLPANEQEALQNKCYHLVCIALGSDYRDIVRRERRVWEKMSWWREKREWKKMRRWREKREWMKMRRWREESVGEDELVEGEERVGEDETVEGEERVREDELVERREWEKRRR